MKNYLAKSILSLMLALSSIAHSSLPASATPEDDLLLHCLDLVKCGEAVKAIDLQNKALKQQPRNAMLHLGASYCYWQQGNVLNAIAEGQQAILLEPDNFLALFNLARMNESLDACENAMSLYRRASRVNPSDAESKVGWARCSFRLGRESDALALLSEMTSSQAQNFDTLFKIAQTYFRLGEPALSARAAQQAVDATSDSLEQSKARALQLLSLLKSNQFDPSARIADETFATCRQGSYELFVRAASTLLPALNPTSAEPLVKAARTNLVKLEDADGFFRLGRIFEDKASYVSYDATKYQAWINWSAEMYGAATSLDPIQSRFHLALGGVLAQQGKNQEAVQEFQKAQSLEPQNPLMPYLAGLAQSGDANHLHLIHASFQLVGLTCGCHSSRIESEVSAIEGVRFIGLSHQEPHQGTLLFDNSKVSLPDIWSKCRQSIAQGPEMKHPIVFSVERERTESVSRIEDVVRIAQNTIFGDVLQFYTTTASIDPVIPVASAAQKLSMNHGRAHLR